MDNLILIAIGILALVLAVILLKLAFNGAVILLAWANESGFVGVAAYVACWVFLFPIMLTGCIISGVVSWWANR